MALIPRKRMSSDLLDPKPKKGSFNGVTSDGVFNATGEAIDNILDDGSASETVVVTVPVSQSSDYTVGNYYEVHGKVAKLRTKTDGDNVTRLTFDTVSGVLAAINGSTGKVAVFEAGERFTNFPTFAQIKAEITKGKTVVIKTSDDEMWYLIRSNSVYCYFEGASDRFQIRVDSENNWTTPEKYDDTFNSQSHNAVQNSVLDSLLNGEGSGEGFKELKYTYAGGLQFVVTHPSTKILSEGFPVDSADYQLVRTFNGFIYKKITGWKVDGTVTVGLWNYDTKQYVAEVTLSSTSEQSPDMIAALTYADASDEMELHVKGSGTIGAIMGAI